MNTDQQTEEWAKVREFPDYEVSSLGNLRRPVGGFKRSINGLKQYVQNGYSSIGLTNKETGVKKTMYVHRVVALSLIPNPENLPCVNHKDGNKLNNSRDNLEWVTYKQNTAHAIETGLFKVSGEYHGRHVLNAAQVIEVVAFGRAGVSKALLGRRYNVTDTAIHMILSGKNWSSVTGIKKTEAAA